MQSFPDQLPSLDAWLAERGYPAYPRQILRWLFSGRARTFADMTDLPARLREELAAAYSLNPLTVADHQRAPDAAEKLLVRLPDGLSVECVLLRDGSRRTVCLSSQAGCAMGCVFCASGLDGVERNLTTGEILGQLVLLRNLLPAGERLSHIVMMGMGEPLANLDNVLAALDVASRPDGAGISPRRITISTVGLPPAIDRLVCLGKCYNLAISLHAANDELRTRLVPVNVRIGIDAVLAAADRYFDTTGRRLTFEYVLLAGINDSRQDASQLVRRLSGRCQLLNVIPYNPVEGLPWRTPSAAAIGEFRQVLEAGGIDVRFRQRKGDRINAACGQLRRSHAAPGPVAVRLVAAAPDSAATANAPNGGSAIDNRIARPPVREPGVTGG